MKKEGTNKRSNNLYNISRVLIKIKCLVFAKNWGYPLTYKIIKIINTVLLVVSIKSQLFILF